jgi:hypothetical protein
MNYAELGDFSEKRSRTKKFRQGSCTELPRVAYRWREQIILGRRLVRKLLAMAILAASITACSKTKDGDLEVEKPVVGTVTDTLNVPSVDVTTDSMKVGVPDVDINKDTATIKVPKVEIKK